MITGSCRLNVKQLAFPGSIRHIKETMKETFTVEDKTLIKIKIDQGFFSLARVYGPFIPALLLAYFYTRPKGIDHKISASQFDMIYLFVFGFFILVFIFFAARDYKKKVAPLRKDLELGSKRRISFHAKKYFDPVYRRYMLYHPEQENKYLLLQEADFNEIAEGDAMELYTGSISGLVLALRLNDKIFTKVEAFYY